MRVLHVTPSFAPTIGGLETVVENLCRRSAELGITADVAHVAPGLAEKSEQSGPTTVWRVPLHGHTLIGLAPSLRKIARSYDLIHAHDPQMLAITGNLIAFANDIPSVLSTHGGFHHTNRLAKFKALHERFLLRSLLRHYRRVLASSRSDLQWFQQFSDHVVLCENGVDVSRFASIPPGADRSPWNWLYWGRQSRNKRLDLIVALARDARRQGAPVTLTLCGPDFDGSGAQVRRKCTSANEDWVHFEPAADATRLAEIIGAAGLHVTASEHEGFGLTVIEALAAGLPVICRDMPPLDSFVDDSCGLRLMFDASEQDRQKLSCFLREAPEHYQKLSENGRRRAARFDWPTVAARFIEHYRAVLEQ